jgi:hypothetical protein
MHGYNETWKVRGPALGRTFATRADAERALEEAGYKRAGEVDEGVAGVVRNVAETEAYKAAAESAKRVFSDYESAKEAYGKLKGTGGGRMLNVDLARELVPEYVADPTLSPAVHEEASAFSPSQPLPAA